MKARVFVRTTRASRMLAGAVALLLISIAFTLPAWAITGGEPDENRHPNVGTVLVYDPFYGRVIPLGSGTLIHEKVFLTAGHVVAEIDAQAVTLLGVSFDSVVDLDGVDPEDSSTWPSTWRRVQSYEYSYVTWGKNSHHPRTANPNEEDIAVLILKEPVTDITPAGLPRAGLLDDLKRAGQLEAGPERTIFTVLGYGFSLDFPPPQLIPPRTAEGTVLRKVAETGYLGLNGGWLHTFQNPAAGYGGTAAGDSGGPTFWNDPETGEDVLVSVTSWGDPNCVAMDFSYRIDTEKSLQFIRHAMASLK